MKLYKLLLIYLVIATTLPFCILLTNINFSLIHINEKLFWSNFWLTIGNIIGFIGTVLLLWEFILGIRHIVGLFTKDLNGVNKLHQWLGKYAILLIFAHPIFSMWSYFESIGWIFIPYFSSNSELHITYGRVGFILLLIIYISSALVRSKIKYRPWLYIHYLSYPLMALVILHAFDIGTYLQKYYVLKILWFLIIIIFIILIVYKIINYAGALAYKAELISKDNEGNEISIITLKLLKKHINILPGQYLYVQLRPLGEAHPFSVIFYNSKTGILKLSFKNMGKFTSKLKLIKSGAILNLDGPYGIFTKEGQNSHSKVIMAGGIGITSFIKLVDEYANKDTILLNSNRKLSDSIFRNELKSKDKIRYYDFLSNDSQKGENIINERIKSKHLEQIIGKNELLNYRYFICGSKKYNSEMKSMLKQLGVSKDLVFSENFY